MICRRRIKMKVDDGCLFWRKADFRVGFGLSSKKGFSLDYFYIAVFLSLCCEDFCVDVILYNFAIFRVDNDFVFFKLGGSQNWGQVVFDDYEYTIFKCYFTDFQVALDCAERLDSRAIVRDLNLGKIYFSGMREHCAPVSICKVNFWPNS